MLRELRPEIFTRLMKGDDIVAIYLWAPWCVPCRATTPIVEAIAKQLDDTLEIYKLNIDEHSEVAEALDVLSVPTVILLKRGAELHRIVGSVSQNTMLRQIQRILRRG